MLSKGAFGGAIADYDAAIEIDPKDANALLGRANAYRGARDLERAKQNLEAALRQAPKFAAAADALDEVNRLIADGAARTSPQDAADTAPQKSAAPAAEATPTPPPAPLASPMALALLALVALLGLLTALVIHFRSKPADKSHLAEADQHARPRDGYLVEFSRLSPGDACARVDSSLEGLSVAEADARLAKFGPNLVAREGKAGILQELWGRARNPLNALLLTLAAVSYFPGTLARPSSSPRWWFLRSPPPSFKSTGRTRRPPNCAPWCIQPRASGAAPCDAGNPFSEIPMERLVPGDVVRLSAGDMIPAELRLLEAKDLFINQSTLTGEAMPAEKYAHAFEGECENPFDLPQYLLHGRQRRVGVRHRRDPADRPQDLLRPARAPDRRATRADRLRPGRQQIHLADDPLHDGHGAAVFLINGLTKHDWLEALLFAVAVAVGLTPEMLPMIVTVNLAKGAIAMSRKKVIVKRLNAIQNFGAMDVLCTDKTGTLTQDRIILKRHLDINGEDFERVLAIRLSEQPFSVGSARICSTTRSWHMSNWRGAAAGPRIHEDRRNSLRLHPPATVGAGRAARTSGVF